MSSFYLDVRLAVKQLRRSPGFSLLVVGLMALGIGANGAIFDTVSRVLLRPLPYPNADRLVAVNGDNPERGWSRFGVSEADFSDWREATSLEHLAAYWIGTGNLTGGEAPVRASYGTVTPSLFQALGTEALHGRTLLPDDATARRDDIVVISHSFWRTNLASLDNPVGHTVRVDGQVLEIVGVMPRGFAFPNRSVGLWRPLLLSPEMAQRRGSRWLEVLGVLAPGYSMADAQREFTTISDRLAAQYPRSNTGWIASIESLKSSFTAGSRPTIILAWSAVGLVLLIASANVANLLLARAMKRESELAIRAALGAGRGRLARQLVVESLVLSFCGAIVGLGLAALAGRVVAGLAPDNWLVEGGRLLNIWVVGYALVLAVVAGGLFGALPAWRATRGDLEPALRAAGGRTVGGRGRRLRGALVAAELALAALVLVASGLTVRSMGQLLAVDPGFEADDRVTLTVAPSVTVIPERSDAVTFYRRVLQDAEQIPGVAATGAINVLPIPGGTWWTASFWPRGEQYPEEEVPVAATRIVSGDYFEAAGIPVLRGRAITPNDDAGAQPVAVIDRTTAERYWPDEDPIGSELAFSRPDGEGEVTWYRVVGVVGPVRNVSLDEAPTPMVYLPLDQAEFGHFRHWGMSLVVKGNMAPGDLSSQLRQVVGSHAPGLPVFRSMPLSRLVADNLAGRSFMIRLLGGFGLLALVLSAAGVYAVLATAVAEQRRDIGMRLALGADQNRILRWVMMGAVRQAAVGLALGLTAAVAGARLLESMLYQVSPTDPVTYLVIAAVLGAVVLCASAVPAWRAASVNPMEVLRSD